MVGYFFWSVCLLGVLVSRLALATTYYVATTGNDANPGTQASPFRTIQHAADIVNPGDTVNVADGTYIDNDGNDVVVYLQRSGSSGSPITFQSTNKWGAKVDGQSNLTKHGFAIEASWIIVKDFEIFGQGGIGGDGITISGSNNQVIGNHIHDIGRQCDNNPFGLDGMFLDVGVNTVLITQNVFHDIGRFGPGENGCSPTTTWYQNLDHGVYVSGGSNITIINNLLYKNGHGWGVHVFPNPVSNLTIVNNTFAFPNPYRVGQIVFNANVTTALVANNIFYQPTTGGFRYAGGTMSGVVLQTNLSTNVPFWNDVSGNTTPPSGLTLTGNFSNTTPNFVSTALPYDFHLQSGSPGIDQGTTVGTVTIDFEGTIRPQGTAYDIGADEYGPQSLCE